jgi:hypothetical protein
MSETQKRVLMITYAFPPAAYVGAHRTLKYCKYLPSNGWLPLVLTIDSRRVAHQDPALCRQIPASVEVHRTRDVDPAKWLDSFRSKAEATGTGAGARRAGGHGSPVPSRQRGFRLRAEGRLRRCAAWTKRLVRRILTESPDSHVFWVPFAIVTGARILLRHRIDVIYCSAPPHSTDLVAWLLGRIFRRPYVLDYRDPWHVRDGAWLQRRVRRMVIRDAMKVIAISPGEREELKSAFPDLAADRFTCITNGYDPADFPAGDPPIHPDDRRMKVTHAGTVYEGAAGELIEGLEQLQRADPSLAERLQVTLIGEIAGQYADAVARLAATGLVRALGPQPHAVAVQHVRGSDVLLILLGGHTFPPSEIPAKTFECLYAGRPILAVAPEGDLSAILRASGLGASIPPGDPDAVAGALGALLAEHASGGVRRVADQACVRAFDRATLSAQLADVLEAAAASALNAPGRRLVAREGQS